MHEGSFGPSGTLEWVALMSGALEEVTVVGGTREGAVLVDGAREEIEGTEW